MIFNTFTFLLPLENFSCLNISNEEKILGFTNSTNTNYGYIFGIVLIVAMVFDIITKTWKLIRKVFNNVNKYDKDDTYETMKPLESIM